MKSNEERVKSIMNKAKIYKKKRGEMLTSATLAVGFAVAILAGVNLNAWKRPEIVENEVPIVTANGTEGETLEGELLTFASKEELLNRLEESAKDYQNQYQKGLRFETNSFGMVDDMAVPESAQAINSAAKSMEAEEDYSKTNVQTEGVDEADIVKTDGKRIYYLNGERRAVRIFENVEGNLQFVKKIELSSKTDEYVYATAMFLDDQHLVVIANVNTSFPMEEEEPVATNASIVAKKMNTPSYLYKSFVKVLIYDVNQYQLIREIDTEGSLVSSRKIGDSLYLVTNKYLYYYSFRKEDIMPLFKDTAVNEAYCEVAIDSIRAFKDFDQENQCNYMMITSLDLSNPNSKVNIDTYLGAGTEIYCSTKNLYVTRANYHYQYRTFLIDALVAEEGVYKDTSSTNIHKFAIQEGKATYVATGEVPGTLLNQFSMDEYQGNFRITTTNDAGNNLYVLDEKLNQIGKLENLAKGERIYSTRFMGDKAYVVTYRTVDPLFVIDLSDSTMPAVLGELKIPGYSSYLHPLGDHYLLGFGEDSVEKSYLDWQGEQQVVAYATGLKMAIFDVSDYAHPKEVQSIKIGGRGSYSELLYDHKALLLDEKRGVIAFPVSLTKEAGYYQDGTPMYGELEFAGALVYDFDVENGFTLEGKITHESENAYGKYGNIERIIYIGDNFYTVSNGMIKATNRDTMQEVSSLKFD